MIYKNVAPGGFRSASVRALVFACCWCGLLAGLAYGWYRVTPRGTISFPSPPLPRVVFDDQGAALQSPTGFLVADIADFQDQFSAYLFFDYLRSRNITSGMPVLLSLTRSQEGPVYKVRMVMANEMISAVPYLADLESKGYIGSFELRFVTSGLLDFERRQTAMFVSSYSRPEAVSLDTVDPEQLIGPVARFLLFKSQTDPRVRIRNVPGPSRLTLPQAQQLAADMIDVARFYSLPLDMLLGVGAMENNYMQWAGDLHHAVWKPRPDPGDIVLVRRRRRVLVRNYALGLWQITRETLRHAHQLYLNDTRDYSQLPQHLRPESAEDFNPDTVPTPLLTTYAGLLLRDLLDRSGGNINTAVGAYNSGLRNPNLQYAEGVRLVGDYARQILQRELVLRRRPSPNEHFLSAADRRPQAPVAASIPSLGIVPAH